MQRDHGGGPYPTCPPNPILSQQRGMTRFRRPSLAGASRLSMWFDHRRAGLEDTDAAEVRLLELLHRLDFARRWCDLCAATRFGEFARSLPDADVAASLESTGRAFRYNRRERFYATREAGAPGELGVNLALRNGIAEFILVVRVPAGHIAGPFSVLMRDVERRFGLSLQNTPRYPQPKYQGATELRQVLAAGFGLYTEVAAAILASGLLVGSGPEAEHGSPTDGGA
jgi:hypothetical protein